MAPQALIIMAPQKYVGILMKLQKHLAYKYKNKEHYKHVLVIPVDAIKKLGWKPGSVLEQKIQNGVLVIKAVENLSTQKRRIGGE